MGQLQRKYKYEASISTGQQSFTGLVLDKFTFPDARGEPVQRHNQALGQISKRGPVTYGEGSFAFALRVSESGNDYSELLETLQTLADKLEEDSWFQITITMVNDMGAQEPEGSYKLTYDFCQLVAITFDELDSRGDDDLVHANVAFIPGKVSSARIHGAQMP